MKGLHGKVAIVTGGGAGIGRATCDAFVSYGTSVVIAEINCESGLETEKLLKQRGGRAIFVKTDISDELSVESMISQTITKFGQIDILINNAACFIFKGVEASIEDWEKIFSVNIIGYAMCIKHIVPQMRKVGRGAIVNVCSMSAFIAQPSFLTYSTTKGALATMTKCLALDLAKDNIRVNSVCPGTVWTKSNEEFIKREFGLNRQEADKHPKIGGFHMLGRTADPSEIAEAIMFLASDSASFITAENLMVDGGCTAQ